ncbi:MAG: ATP-binding protein [Chloroflexota bacterium]
MKKEISFGGWLRNQRRLLDLTRQALANQVGCAEITVRRIENGTLKPSKELALILLEQLGIPESNRSQWIQFARGLAEYPEQPVSSLPVKPLTNLPSLLTNFIGREKEQAEIIQSLNKHRLVTLTGSGGVGKTRLAIEVGEQILGNYINGIWLAELASLKDPTLLPQTITALFGLVTQSNTPITEVLINFLRNKSTLLILDNCEHLLNTCAQLTDKTSCISVP